MVSSFLSADTLTQPKSTINEQEMIDELDNTEDSWRNVEGELEHYFLMQENIQKELEKINTALMIYDALLAIIPCITQDARRIEENLKRER